ncbi:FkbM family methyltransferase [Rhodobacterales bacterium LSUCC0246]|nr:FkbM family methyltransferase [Rhodobacterales bacterium LSUCC0374]
MRQEKKDISPTTLAERALDRLSNLPGEIGYVAFRKLKRRLQAKAELLFQRELNALSASDLVLDLGANIGDLTELFALKGCEVHAFEPEPETFKLLKQRFETYPKVHLHNAAVGIEEGEAELVVPSSFRENPRSASKASSITLDRYNSPNAIRHNVRVVNIIDFISKCPRRPKLIKFDIEGAELDILEKFQAENVLSQETMVFVETHERLERKQLPRVKFLQEWARNQAEPYINLFWG